MKKILVIALLMVFAMTGTALAGGTSTVTMQAVVLTACSVSGDVTIDFGNLDPVAAPLVSIGFASPTVTCNGNTALTVANTSTGNIAGPGGNIPYTFAVGVEPGR